MKPLSLEFTAFGSYPGTETIDFTSLAELGLYIVTGPTGSGKTTIFDAMAYALYGEVPGVREKGDIRSQHAPDTVECSVTFRFEVDGTIYRVERTPEQYKARQRGTGDPVKVVAKARLVCESDDTPLESRVTTVTAKCIDLIGLKADQFERVVLLPQGRFQQFLLADTAERLPLLRQLFGTGKWLDVVDDLKARSRDASAAVESIEKELDKRRFAIGGDLDAAAMLLDEGAHAVPIPVDAGDGIDLADDNERGAGPDDVVPEADAESLDAYAGHLALLDARASERKALVDALGVRAGAAETALATVNGLITNWDRRARLRDELAGLDADRPAIEALRSGYAASMSAAPVVDAGAIAERDAEALARSVIADDSARAELGLAVVAAGLPGLLDPDVAMNRITEARSDLIGRREAVRRLVEINAVLADLENRRALLAAERVERTERRLAVAGELDAANETLDALDALAVTQPARQALVEASERVLLLRRDLAEVATAEPGALTAQREATDRQREAMRRFDDAAAPRLAESLTEGEACPVCGSIDHPAPAAADDVTPVDSSERDSASSDAVRAVSELQELITRRGVLEGLLGDDASRSAEELETIHVSLVSDRTVAGEAAVEATRLRSSIEFAEAERGQILSRVAEIDLELAGIEPMINSAIAGVAEHRPTLGGLFDEWSDDPERVDRALEVERRAYDDAEEAVATCRDRANEFTEVATRAESSAVALAAAVAASSFESVEDALVGARAVDERESMAMRLDEYDRKRTANATLSCDVEALDLPDERPDATDLQSVAAAARADSDSAADAFSRIADRLGQARSDLAEARDIEGESADAVDRSRMLQALARTCDGQGPKRISLETWVLAGELDRVAAAANHHLGRMTASRYQIERTDDAGHGGRQAGLDLRILDSHTGRARRPGSLSGGEQFQASLALALGLADVIGHGGSTSGRVFEALFVDEGFGSLDPDSLGQAVDALHQINASGRTVGVITHVEAMKDDLPTGIRVDRLGDGEGSTLVVRPNG